MPNRLFHVLIYGQARLLIQCFTQRRRSWTVNTFGKIWPPNFVSEYDFAYLLEKMILQLAGTTKIDKSSSWNNTKTPRSVISHLNCSCELGIHLLNISQCFCSVCVSWFHGRRCCYVRWSCRRCIFRQRSKHRQPRRPNGELWGFSYFQAHAHFHELLTTLWWHLIIDFLSGRNLCWQLRSKKTKTNTLRVGCGYDPINSWTTWTSMRALSSKNPRSPGQ